MNVRISFENLKREMESRKFREFFLFDCSSKFWRFGILFAGYFLLLLALHQFSFAQDDSKEIAPPPLKMLSKDEKSRLAAESDVKERTKLALELMEARLLKAENFKTSEQYREMFTELGGFHALMDNTLDFLDKKNKDGKVLNNFKRIELSLRKYATRLELIRRDLPAKYEFYVRGLIKYVRDARARAVEPLFDDTVVPNNQPNL